MEAIPRDYGEQCRFDAFCKTVLRNEARNYHRDMKRQRDRETSFSVLPQAELDKLYTVDHGSPEKRKTSDDALAILSLYRANVSII